MLDIIIMRHGRIERVIGDDLGLAQLPVLVARPGMWYPGDVIELPHELHHVGRSVLHGV